MTDDGSRELLTLAASLTAAVDGLRESIESLLKRTRRSEKVIASIVVTIIVDLVFTAGFIFLFYNQNRTADALDDTRSSVLCPMYSAFLGAYNPNSRAPGADRDTYEGIFAQLRTSYVHLNCTTPFVPKPTSTAPAPK